jgi:hypothetical protein
MQQDPEDPLLLPHRKLIREVLKLGSELQIRLTLTLAMKPITLALAFLSSFGMKIKILNLNLVVMNVCNHLCCGVKVVF